MALFQAQVMSSLIRRRRHRLFLFFLFFSRCFDVLSTRVYLIPPEDVLKTLSLLLLFCCHSDAYIRWERCDKERFVPRVSPSFVVSRIALTKRALAF